MANHISVEHVPAAQDVYEIKVMVDALSDGGYAITGVGLDPRGKAIEKTKRVRKAISKAKIYDTKRFVKNLVNAALVTNVAKSQKRNTSDSLDETNPYVIAFRRVMESEHPINPKWNNETRQTALTYFSRHTLPFLVKFEDALIAGEVSGADCGIALMAWGGIDLKRALTWESIHFDSTDPTLVVVDIHQPDLAGATHDYSRPAAPFCALVLRKRYESLKQKYTVEELTGAPVVSTKKNALKVLSNEAFLGDATRILRAIASDTVAGNKNNGGTAAAKRVLRNTYINNVYTRLGFDDDIGTKAFLCEERMKDVTSDNYTKFNDLDGIARIHAAEMILSPPEEIDNTELVETLPDGKIKYTFWPDSMRKTAGVGCDVLVPTDADADITLYCPHGVEFVIKPREIKEDGSVRRASRKRVKKDTQDTLVSDEGSEASQTTEPSLADEAPQCSDQQESANEEQQASQAVEKPILPQSAEMPRARGKQRGPKKEPLIEGQDSFF